MLGQSWWQGYNGQGVDSFLSPLMPYNLYDPAGAVTRGLYHSGLDLSVSFPLLPGKTTNFAFDILARRDMVVDKTLSSKKVSIWDPIVDDIEIVQTWDAPGGLSFPWSFFHDLHRMYTTPIDWASGQYMVWAPTDRTNMIYAVDMIDLQVDGQDFNVTWNGLPDDFHNPMGVQNATTAAAGTCVYGGGRDIYSASTLEVRLILRPETAPNVSVSFLAGSTTTEATQFESE